MLRRINLTRSQTMQLPSLLAEMHSLSFCETITALMHALCSFSEATNLHPLPQICHTRTRPHPPPVIMCRPSWEEHTAVTPIFPPDFIRRSSATLCASATQITNLPDCGPKQRNLPSDQPEMIKEPSWLNCRQLHTRSGISIRSS